MIGSGETVHISTNATSCDTRHAPLMSGCEVELSSPDSFAPVCDIRPMIPVPVVLSCVLDQCLSFTRHCNSAIWFDVLLEAHGEMHR